ncbi:sensor histidine kinase [Marinobacterium aestuariivivens]|uniref:histidine kinase n=1 Tax=Marinobacterium aestuariivivens TaxID=1698799 RepID=A0ABW2A9Y9_9GAMM
MTPGTWSRLIANGFPAARLEQDESWGEPSASVVALLSGALADLADLPSADRLKVQAGSRGLVAVPVTLVAVAVRNLVENALRHTQAGSPVELSMAGDGTNVIFAVKDQGADHQPQHAGAVATAQSDRPPSRGHGLGLTIVEAIVNRFDGQLQFQRRASGGLEAQLMFPASPAEPTGSG